MIGYDGQSVVVMRFLSKRTLSKSVQLGPQDPHMRSAAAQVRLEARADFGFRGVRIFLKQGLRPHHHPRYAVAALRGLLFKESPLHRAWLLSGAEPFEGYDVLSFQGLNGKDAGERRLAIDDHRAGAALGKSASELRGVQLQVAAQHIEQRRFGVRIERVRPAVHGELYQRGVS
jgi:hypothetical protein